MLFQFLGNWRYIVCGAGRQSLRFAVIDGLGSCVGAQGRPSPIRHIARYSHHGPLFSDAVPPLRKGLKKNQALVFASVAREF